MHLRPHLGIAILGSSFAASDTFIGGLMVGGLLYVVYNGTRLGRESNEHNQYHVRTMPTREIALVMCTCSAGRAGRPGRGERGCMHPLARSVKMSVPSPGKIKISFLSGFFFSTHLAAAAALQRRGADD